MAYSAFSVVFGEQPSAAKWNILGTNDASFNNGTGIANLATNVTSISNPYKFSVYRNAAANSGNNTFALVTFDTKTGANAFDTNGDYSTSTGKYTAPVNGFYQFNFQVTFTSAAGYNVAGLFKNGVESKRGTEYIAASAGDTSLGGGGLVQMTAGDYVQVNAQSPTGGALVLGVAFNYFTGFLVSQS